MARTEDVHFLAVFGDRPPSHVEPERLQPSHQFDIAVRLRFVLAVDQLLQLDPDLVPRDIFSVLGRRSAHEEHPQRKDATMSLQPFIAYCPADGGHMNADFFSDLLHLQRLDKLGPAIKELFLVFDDCLSRFRQRASALLDRFDQPLSGH